MSQLYLMEDIAIWIIIKSGIVVRRTALADWGILYNMVKDEKKTKFLRIEPLIKGEMFAKNGQKLFTN